MEEGFIVTRRRRRSEANVAPEPGPSTLEPAPETAISEDELEDEVEVLEREVTVEEFLQWSAASRTASKKTRRLVKLGAPSDDIASSSSAEDELSPPAARKRKRALPQLPASDDEYEPSSPDTPARPARKRTTYKGKARSIAGDLLRAGALSGVAVDTAALPALPQGRRPLQFAAVRAVTPPPGVKNGHLVRVVDPRTIEMKRSVFHEQAAAAKRARVQRLVPPPMPPLPPGTRAPLNRKPRRRRGTRLHEGPAVSVNRPVVRSPVRESRPVPTEEAGAGSARPGPFVFPPLTFVPVCIPGTRRVAPNNRGTPPSSRESFFVNLCSDEEDDGQPQSRPLSISSSPVAEVPPRADIRIAGPAAADGAATASDAGRRIPLHQTKRWPEKFNLSPNPKPLFPLHKITEVGAEMALRYFEQQRKQSMR
ncbi:hypothetical protein PsYK624_047570 [Phanerochaete sordida]|uniref:Uncharacterized protein n=1 Tax=Phanerochaete sordida TaxID=48140 RepID=A0A9P3LBL5_9APHY|nr:hypothetical protein PsYK624_047570 [Phanerochaete sordida]